MYVVTALLSVFLANLVMGLIKAYREKPFGDSKDPQLIAATKAARRLKTRKYWLGLGLVVLATISYIANLIYAGVIR